MRFALLSLAGALAAQGASTARANVLSYVKKPDKSYAWKKVRNANTSAGTAYTLRLTSQTWHGMVWEHDLLVVVPPKATPKATMLLWNQGGKPSPGSIALAFDLAGKTKAPVAFLYGIPNQPLLGNRKEDALIAETFVRYLDTGDASWPLLFPMTKSLVRAMDALQEFAKQEWKAEVRSFVVTGGSKRGWTSWLTAVADPRVKAVAPLVIDTLNVRKQMPHQLASYGKYSAMIKDYTERELVPMPKTPEAQRLWSMVDPWAYRAKLTMPKLIVNGTNDPYWTQDALNLYWDDLQGDKWVLYVPNAGHDLAQRVSETETNQERAGNTLAAFARHQIDGTAMPRLRWKHADVGGKHRVTVECRPEPKAARLWVAEAATRDFRRSVWKEHEAKVAKGTVTAEVSTPASGFRVFLVECEYELDGLRYCLSTQLRIVGKE
jgi:PhoPQ-activated pathogenicity-related protein